MWGSDLGTLVCWAKANQKLNSAKNYSCKPSPTFWNVESIMSPSSKPDELAALVVSPKNGAVILGIGLTQVYKLINAREVESYRDGKSRKIVVASLKAYVERQIAAEATKQRPRWTDRATEARIAKRAGLLPRRRTRRGSWPGPDMRVLISPPSEPLPSGMPLPSATVFFPAAALSATNTLRAIQNATTEQPVVSRSIWDRVGGPILQRLKEGAT
jgi:excisionase family DNA binding protein